MATGQTALPQTGRDNFPFNVAVESISAHTPLRVACPCLSLGYSRGLLRTSDWQLLTDVEEWPTEADGRVTYLIQVCDTTRLMPTATTEKQCRADVLEVVKAAVRALKAAGMGPGRSADLTMSGELVNPKDKKGYRLAGRKKDNTPSLFD